MWTCTFFEMVHLGQNFRRGILKRTMFIARITPNYLGKVGRTMASFSIEHIQPKES